MSRLIDADALIADCQLAQKQADRHGREYANAFYSDGGEISTEWWCVEDMIENAPTAEPQRIRGKWIPHHEELNGSRGGVICSECGWKTHNKMHLIMGCSYRFCPNCGAWMGGQDGNT